MGQDNKWDGINLAEILFASEEDAWDQPCRWGHRVNGHAVYCHNDEWTEGPRKCRRTWYTGGDVRDEDCPGFKPNKCGSKLGVENE